MTLWNKIKQNVRKVVEVTLGSWRDLKRVVNDAKDNGDMVDKSKKIIPSNIQRVFGVKSKNTYLIVLWAIPLVFGGVKLVQDDFIIIRNVHYAITSDVVMEEEFNKKDANYQKLELENAQLRGVNEQLEKTNESLLKHSHEQQQKYVESIKELQVQPEETVSE